MSNINKETLFIDVGTLNDILNLAGEQQICIPEYQRPYVWDTDKVDALLNDLLEFEENLVESHYYIGAILFHRTEGSLNIIDGQQRLTTLLTLDYVLNNTNSMIGDKDSLFQMIYTSPISEGNIVKNKEHIIRRLSIGHHENEIRSAFSKIIFTYIITDREDDAFTFFDSQNNRGVMLSAVDFLKSYHLKSIKGELEQDEKQSLVAKRWDLNNADQYLDRFFKIYLWRGRNWKGKNIQFENKDRILCTFQKSTKDSAGGNIKLYANFKNRLASELNFSAVHGIQVRPQAIPMQIKAKDIPFSLRQPIQKGVAFFLYSEKYVDLYRFIFNTVTSEGSELHSFIQFYQDVIIGSGFNGYLKDLFEICTLLYYDRFGAECIYEFGLWLDYLLGAYRVRQSSIVAQTPVRIVRDLPQNLLDVIESAYAPYEIFSFIKEVADNAAYENEQISGNGVQNRYKREVTKFYNQSEGTSLKNKITWINEKLRKY